jgi:hypothetical protein
MNAPCPHCEQISTRGSDAAVAAPICPQLGQTIRVSMSVTTAAAGAAARSSLAQQLRQLGDVGGDAPCLVAGEQLDRRAPFLGQKQVSRRDQDEPSSPA